MWLLIANWRMLKMMIPLSKESQQPRLEAVENLLQHKRRCLVTAQVSNRYCDVGKGMELLLGMLQERTHSVWSCNSQDLIVIGMSVNAVWVLMCFGSGESGCVVVDTSMWRVFLVIASWFVSGLHCFSNGVITYLNKDCKVEDADAVDDTSPLYVRNCVNR